MNYVELFTEYHVARLYDWLTELGELFVRLEYPHSGGAGRDFLVRNLEDLQDLISRQNYDELEIFIFRAIIFPIRGSDYSALLERALREIPAEQYYEIAALPPHTRESRYLVSPHQCETLADGKGHDGLRSHIADLEPGREIAIGVHPFDTSDEEFKQFHGGPVDRMSFQVRRTYNWYDKFSSEPAKYQEVIKRWFGPARPD